MKLAALPRPLPLGEVSSKARRRGRGRWRRHSFSHLRWQFPQWGNPATQSVHREFPRGRFDRVGIPGVL